MIIEIGTSDFRTQAGQVDGVFIEPVKYYFDRMVAESTKRMYGETKSNGNSAAVRVGNPSRAKCKFENVAISNYEGEAEMYYMSEVDRVALGLPQWVRGCNSINKPHPSIVKIVEQFEENLFPDNWITKKTVKVVRIKSIIDKYNITELDLLKIDTEGHDTIILNDYLDTVGVMPKVIQFESNILSSASEVDKLVIRLTALGYKCKQVEYDMVCRL